MQPAPTGLYVSAATSYLQRFGWPCVADGYAVWTLAGQAFDAIDVPATLGPAILTRLNGRADVIHVPRNRADRWRFLIDAQLHTPHWVRANLAKHAAVHLTNVDRIDLPPTRARHGELRWLHGPAGNLTPLDEFLAALRG